MLSWNIPENRNVFSQGKNREIIQQERFFMPSSSWALRQGVSVDTDAAGTGACISGVHLDDTLTKIMASYYCLQNEQVSTL